MGCDIHIYLETKVDNKWIMVNELEGEADTRNYNRFAMLAGVRGNGPEPKGLPDDISDSVKFHAERWGNDGHSHSYMDVKDAAKIFLSTTYEPSDYAIRYPLSAYFNIEESEQICKCCGQIKPENDYRIVFWFDN